MDATEAAALAMLSEREAWALDELPAGIDADVLRCLDVSGCVRVRAVFMSNRGPGVPWEAVRDDWISPAENPTHAGGWDVVALKRTRDATRHPYEVGVTERGRAELARWRRQGEPVATGARSTCEAALDLLLKNPPDLTTEYPDLTLWHWLRSVAHYGAPLVPARYRPLAPTMSPVDGVALKAHVPDEVTACRWVDGLAAVLLRGDILADSAGHAIGALTFSGVAGAAVWDAKPGDDEPGPYLVSIVDGGIIRMSVGYVLSCTLRCAGVVLRCDRARPNALIAWLETARAWDAAMKHAHTSRISLPDDAYTRGIRKALPALEWTFGEALHNLEPGAHAVARDASLSQQVWPLVKRIRQLLGEIQGAQGLDDRPGCAPFPSGLLWKRHQLGEAFDDLRTLADVPPYAPAAIQSEGDAQPGVGKQWREIHSKAERYVKKHGWPGVRELARALECAPATVRKATDDSLYLKAREAEHKAGRPRGRSVALSDALLQTTAAPDSEATLRKLMAESERDNASDPGPFTDATRPARPRQRP